MTDKTRTLIILHTAVFLAGWTGLFGRWISLSGLPLVWYRVMVSVVTMFSFMLISGKFHRVGRKALVGISSCGVLLAMHWVAFYASIKASNVSVGVACIATSCFFTTIFDPLINRKRISVRDVLISFIAIAGIMLIFSLDLRYRIGIALGLLSAAIYSVFALMNINVAKATGEDSATMLMYELIAGVVFLSLCMIPFSTMNPGAQTVPTRSDIIALLCLGSVFSVIPFLFQIHALRKLHAFTVNVAYNLEPVYSIFFAAIFFGETKEVGLSFWTGLFLIVISVVLQTYVTLHGSGRQA